jgi:trehalose 6-phosphate phosphatase
VHWEEAKDDLLRGLIEAPRLGLICDFDGTLSHIVPHPDQARLTERNNAVLRELEREVALVAFISGRAADDLLERVGLLGAGYVGNHGMEIWLEGELQAHPEVVVFSPALEQIAKKVEALAIPGLFVEYKRVTLSVHYRGVDNPEKVAAELKPILEVLSEEHGLSMFSGRMIFEIRPPIAINKGTAFRDLVLEHKLDAAVFMGDDTTDADAMKMAQQMRADGVCYSVALGVLGDETPTVVLESSDVLARGIDDVSAFLEWLARSLKASSS